MKVLKIIQAHIQSIMFNKKVLQMISSIQEHTCVKMVSSQTKPNMEFCVNWNVRVWSIQNNTN
jgi:hypothetical protein